MKRPWDPLGTVCVLSLLAVTAACIPGEIDSLFTVEAPKPSDRFTISKHIRDAELWKVYLEHLADVRAGDGPVIAIDVRFDREVTEEDSDGDYDEGIVRADFELTELRTETTLLADQFELEIPIYVIVSADATRAEVQDEAFAEVEKKAVRRILGSLDRAVVRAMGAESCEGAVFIPVLENVRENVASPDLTKEAELALDAIRASASCDGDG